MGQQAYETRLAAELRACTSDWVVDEFVVRSMRSGSGRGRVPLRIVWSAPWAVAAAVGASLYRDADLVHRLDLRCPPAGRRREVLTVHDLPPLRFPDEGSLPSWAAKSARSAAAVICPSRFAADEVKDLLGTDGAIVVPNGVDRWRSAIPPLSGAELAESGLRRPFVVHAAGATARKNLPLLARAWAGVAAEHPEVFLAMCGPPHPRRAQHFDGAPNVRYLGMRDPKFVARLMRSAAAVVVPSAYEGFGLPALEGMAAGVPVVAVSAGALPEVCGDAALLVRADADELAAAISRVLHGGDAIEGLRQRGRIRAASFTWARTARETLAVYEGVLG